MKDLERIEKIVDDMVDIKADLEKDIKCRDARIQELEKKLEDVVSDTSTLLAETKSRNAKFDKKLIDKDTRIKELEKKLEDVVSDTSTLLAETKSRNAKFDKKLIDKDTRIKELEKKLEDVVSDTSTLLAETKSKNAKFDQTLIDKDTRIKELEKKLEDVVSDTSTLLAETKSKNAKFDKTLIDKDTRIKELEKKLEDVVSDTSTETRINELEKKLDNVITVNTGFSAEIRAKNSYINQLKKELNVFNDRLIALDNKIDTKQQTSELSPSKSSASKTKAKNVDNMVKIVSAELADLVKVKKDQVMKYDQIVGRLWNYIKTNNLQDLKNKKMFTPDDKMKQIFGKEKKIFHGNRSFKKILQAHISKA